MKNNFAKIIQLEHHQVLVTKEGYNEDEKAFEVKIRTFHNGVSVGFTIGNKSEERINKSFESYSEEQAVGFINNVLAMSL